MVVALVAACDPGEREARPYAGRWESDGFGLYLDVHGSGIDVFEHTDRHCLQIAAAPARGVSDVISDEGGRLVLRDGGRVIRFDEVPALPASCAERASADPSAVFTVAVATIAELHYPAPGDAWLARAADLGESLTAGTDEEGLVGVLIDALALLGDPEIRLATRGVAPSWPSAPVIGARLEQRWPSAWEGRAVAGEAAPGVAYLGLLRLVVESEGDQRGLASALDAALAGADGAIVDLRAASGGVEEAALQVATRFVPTQGVVASLRARSGDGLVPAGELSVTPLATGTFPGPVVVLVGPGTSGAGELLARILSGLPGVTIVGGPTSGSPREPLVRSLPNGWSLGVPNLDVIGPDGASWLEPLIPDVDAPTTAGDLEAGGDPGLEAALRLLGGGL